MEPETTEGEIRAPNPGTGCLGKSGVGVVRLALPWRPNAPLNSGYSRSETYPQRDPCSEHSYSTTEAACAVLTTNDAHYDSAPNVLSRICILPNVKDEPRRDLARAVPFFRPYVRRSNQHSS